MKRQAKDKPKSVQVDRAVVAVGRLYFVADEWSRQGEVIDRRVTRLGAGIPQLARYVGRPI